MAMDDIGKPAPRTSTLFGASAPKVPAAKREAPASAPTGAKGGKAESGKGAGLMSIMAAEGVKAKTPKSPEDYSKPSTEPQLRRITIEETKDGSCILSWSSSGYGSENKVTAKDPHEAGEAVAAFLSGASDATVKKDAGGSSEKGGESEEEGEGKEEGEEEEPTEGGSEEDEGENATGEEGEEEED